MNRCRAAICSGCRREVKRAGSCKAPALLSVVMSRGLALVLTPGLTLGSGLGKEELSSRASCWEKGYEILVELLVECPTQN